MSIRWKLFALANYVLLLSYLFFFVMAIRFLTKVEQDGKGLAAFILVIASVLITILNSIFNLYVFHKHLPKKIFSRSMGIFYSISTILFTISWTIILVSYIKLIDDAISSSSANNSLYFPVSVFLLSLFCGLIILGNQVFVRDFITKNYKADTNEMIENIGQPE